MSSMYLGVIDRTSIYNTTATTGVPPGYITLREAWANYPVSLALVSGEIVATFYKDGNVQAKVSTVGMVFYNNSWYIHKDLAVGRYNETRQNALATIGGGASRDPNPNTDPIPGYTGEKPTPYQPPTSNPTYPPPTPPPTSTIGKIIITDPPRPPQEDKPVDLLTPGKNLDIPEIDDNLIPMDQYLTDDSIEEEPLVTPTTEKWAKYGIIAVGVIMLLAIFKGKR